MPGIQSALLEWLAKVLKKPKLHISQLTDPKYLHELLLQIPNTPPIQLTPYNMKHMKWHINYTNFKNLFQIIENYYKNVIRKSFPTGLPAINLLDISKGQDQDGLITIMIILFLAYFHSGQQQKCVTYILELQQNLQEELKKLIEQKIPQPLDILQQQQNIYELQKIQRNKIDEYLFKIKSLGDENISLTKQLQTIIQQKSKQKQQILKYQTQLRKLKRQLDQKNLYIHQKQQQQQQQQYTKRIISDSNQQIIHMLRKQMVEQQKQHLQQKKQMQQKIQNLNQQLNILQNKIYELENMELIGITNNRKIHHQDCVSINQHKNITHKLQIKFKNFEQKQTQLQRQILRNKYQYEQLSRKYKKQEKQKLCLKVQYQKITNNRPMLITPKDAQKVKVSVLEAIRTKLKNKLEIQKKGQIYIQGQ